MRAGRVGAAGKDREARPQTTLSPAPSLSCLGSHYVWEGGSPRPVGPVRVLRGGGSVRLT